MSGRFLVGLDWGGGGGRAVLVDAETGLATVARRAWRARPLPDTGGLGWTCDLVGGLAALGEATAEVLARAGVDPAEVAGIAATAVRFGQVLIGPDGAVVDVAASRDAQAAGESLRLGAAAPRLQARTGHWPLAILAGPRLQRLVSAGQLPEGTRAVALNDWLTFELCGELATDLSQASATGLFDVRARTWAEDEVAALGVPTSLLPRVVASGERLGGLRAEAADRLGLPAGIAVAAGGSDSACALLGAGALEAGARVIVAGTTAPVLAVTDRPELDPRLFTELHVVPDRWMVDSNAGPVGEALEWLAALLFPSDRAPVARLLGEAASSQPGAAGIAVSVGAQVLDARNMHFPVGHVRFAPALHESGAAGRADLARAGLEGVLFAWQANLEQLDEVAGISTGPLVLAGGLGRSDLVAGLLAEVTGRTVTASGTLDGTGVGAALCAGVGAGVFADFGEAAGALPAPRATFEPDAADAARYAELYAGWHDDRADAAAFDAGTERRALVRLLGGESRAPAAASEREPRIFATCDLDAEARAALGRVGPTEHQSYREHGRLLTGRKLEEALEGCEVFVTEIDLVDARVVAACPGLRVVASCRGDAVNVDVAACTAHGVPVLNTPGRNADAVADLTVAFLLMLARQLPAATAFLRNDEVAAGDIGKMGQAFTQLRGRELGERTVGLVGFGAVGRAVARRLHAFGTAIRVFDPFVAVERVAAAGAEAVPLDVLLESSDAVSLHAPVTDETRGLIGAAELARMRAGAVLVNTARAALVDEEALVQALQSGHLGGAALDVFSVEPPGCDHPLLQLPQVIATPHVGGNTAEVAGHQGRSVAEDLARLLRGERPHAILNPEVLASFDWTAERPTLPPERLAELAARPAPAVSDLQRDDSGARKSAEPSESTSGVLPAETCRRMERILAGFVERAVVSGVLREHARHTDVTLHFRIPDLGAEFHLSLEDGRVTGALAAPASTAEVELKLAADVLDGMFTGRVNAMQSAMDGKLSFTGDTAKAMTLQDLQGELSRCYGAARDEVGDPGDLTVALAPTAAGSAPLPDVRVDIVNTVNELYAQELITATGGNVSARVPGEDRIWITPSQLFKGDLRPEVLVPLDLDARPLDPDARAPSSERKIHCAIYAARPEAGAVIHSHAPHATILANTDLPFLPISTEAAFFGNIPRIPFIMPGTDALAEAVGLAAREEWAILMKNHGLIVAGRSLRRAADMSEIIERTAEVILGCYAVGREPPVLPDEAVETLRKMGDLIA